MIKDGPSLASAGSQTRPGGNTHVMRPHNEEGRENPPPTGLLLSKHAIEMFVLNLRNSSCFAHWNSQKKRKRSIKDGPSAGSQTRPGGNTHDMIG